MRGGIERDSSQNGTARIHFVNPRSARELKQHHSVSGNRDGISAMMGMHGFVPPQVAQMRVRREVDDRKLQRHGVRLRVAVEEADGLGSAGERLGPDFERAIL